MQWTNQIDYNNPRSLIDHDHRNEQCHIYLYIDWEDCRVWTGTITPRTRREGCIPVREYDGYMTSISLPYNVDAAALREWVDGLIPQLADIQREWEIYDTGDGYRGRLSERGQALLDRLEGQRAPTLEDV